MILGGGVAVCVCLISSAHRAVMSLIWVIQVIRPSSRSDLLQSVTECGMQICATVTNDNAGKMEYAADGGSARPAITGRQRAATGPVADAHLTLLSLVINRRIACRIMLQWMRRGDLLLQRIMRIARVCERERPSAALACHGSADANGVLISLICHLTSSNLISTADPVLGGGELCGALQ